jgi:hypothetical protein
VDAIFKNFSMLTKFKFKMNMIRKY